MPVLPTLPEVERHEEALGRVGDLEAELMNLDSELRDTDRALGGGPFVGKGETAEFGEYRRMDDIRADKKQVETLLKQAREVEERRSLEAQRAAFKQSWEVGGEEFTGEQRRDVEARIRGQEARGGVEDLTPAEPSLGGGTGTFMDRVVEERRLTDTEERESRRLFDTEFLEEVEVRGAGRAAGRGALDPTGFVLENYTDVFINGINPGGRVNIVSRRKGGEVAINTGQGSRGIKRTNEGSLIAALRAGELKLSRGVAKIRPAGSVPREKGQGAKSKKKK